MKKRIRASEPMRRRGDEWIGTLGLAGGLAFALAWSVGSSRAQTATPSFDCRKAASADERTICADDRLAAMDRLESSALGMVPDKDEYFRKRAADALKDRRACGANALCILDNQAAAILIFDGYGAHARLPAWLSADRLRRARDGVKMIQGLPAHVGTCTQTKIASLLVSPSPDDVEGGSSVVYGNGGYGTSYDYEAGLAGSRIGDEVLMCLVSIPRHCPPGDARGRFYAATNLRTMATWVLPDARHRCGGA